MIDVIVLGLSPTGLGVVRDVARAGYRVLGVGAPGAPGLASRYLTEGYAADTPETRVAYILRRPLDGPKPALIVTSDQDLDAVIAQGAALADRVHLPGDLPLMGQILDKAVFYGLCDTHNVAYPKHVSVDVSHAAQLQDQLAWPVLIKPARIQDVKHLMAGRKGWVIRDGAEFKRVLPQIPPQAGLLLAQEIVPGPESNITLWCGYIGADGTVRQRLTARKLRQYPPGFGSASLVQTAPEAQTAQIAEGLLGAIGYRGIAAAEFKRDPRCGTLKIIEINPRPSLWFSVAAAADVPLHETAAAEALGRPLPGRMAQTDGVRWRYGLKDLASRLLYRRNRGFVLPPPDCAAVGAARRRTSPVWARSDPGPLFKEITSMIHKAGMRYAR